MSSCKPQVKRRASARQSKRLKGTPAGGLAAMRLAAQAAKNLKLLGQRLVEMRGVVRAMASQLDELEVILRAMDVLESKQAVRSWLNGLVPALGARPIDLCRTAQGREAVLRELGRIEHGVHS